MEILNSITRNFYVGKDFLDSKYLEINVNCC